MAAENWVSLLTTAVVGVALLAIKRVYFHPLSRFPGPKLWALTRVPYLLSMRGGRLAHDIKHFHEVYGDAVRLAPNEVAWIDPQAIRDIYGRVPNQKAMSKDPVRYQAPRPGQTISLLDAHGKDHARIRKAISFSFSDRALTQQEPIVVSYVDKLIGNLEARIREGERVFDLEKWCSYCTFDIICSLSFGEDFECLDRDRYHEWLGMLVYSLKAKVQAAACRYYPWLFSLLMMFSGKSAKDAFAKHGAITRDKVRRRLSSSVDRPDFLEHLQKSENREGLTEAEIELNAATLIVAGTHTLQTAIAGTLLQLVQNPEELEQIVAEIRASFDSEADMSNRKLSKLPVLSAVIQEGLRITSPVPLGGTREVAEGGATICGEWIPPGMIVSFMPWAATSSKRNFANPDKFAPVRWLSAADSPEASDYSNDRRDANQLFLLGPRDCIGQNLAWLEIRLIVARLLYSFDIEAADAKTAQSKWGEGQDTYAVWVRTPMMAKLKIASRP